MAEYTEQEIEMLARHMWETDVFSPSWSEASDEQREQARSCIRRGNASSRITEAAARLMREAREQGASEMKAHILAIAKRDRTQASETIRKNLDSGDAANNAAVEARSSKPLIW